MKKTFIILFLLPFILIFFGFLFRPENEAVNSPPKKYYLYEDLHYPYGINLPKEKLESLFRDLNNAPDEKNFTSAGTNPWRSIGPYYNTVQDAQSVRWTGRIHDIKIEANSDVLVAGAGGLWKLGNPSSPLSDKINNALTITTFDSKPDNNNIIIAGTGQEGDSPGYGIYRTADRGVTWNNISLTDSPEQINKIRFDPTNTSKVHAATNRGVYTSLNDGLTWQKNSSLGDKRVTDLVIHPANQNIIYAAVWSAAGGGIWKTTDGGLNWVNLNTNIPNSNIGNTKIDICRTNPNVLYTSMTKNDSNTTLGVYKTVDGGSSWTAVTASSTIHGGQGFHTNLITVNPFNSNIALVGGVELWRTTDGSSFVQVSDAQVHADLKTGFWKDANTLYIGNDGGITKSVNAGASWSTSENILPITQFFSIDNGVSNTNYLYGAAQDNGVCRSTNGGLTWFQVQGGDGGGVAIDPNNPSNNYCTNGVWAPPFPFRRQRSTNSGVNWSFVDTGIDTSSITGRDQWYTKIRTDAKAGTADVYTFVGNYAYRSSNLGAQWSKINSTPFYTRIYNLTVSRCVNAVVYICLSNSSFGDRLKVYDRGVLEERSTGLPSRDIKIVRSHSRNTLIGYAITKGVDSTGGRIFRTTNRGVSWTHVPEGDLPATGLAITDIVPHANNIDILYLGTEFGCFRTTNGGTNWHRWNNGMPNGNVVTEMGYIDSLETNNKFYVTAGTYGRSMWIREASDDDNIVSIGENGNTIPNKFELAQNFPNPFNPSTTIKFALPKNDNVRLKVYDISGREVAVLLDQYTTAGNHNIRFDGDRFSSGVYFYTIETSKYRDVKKMILIK
jgi:photosystem II stability/assembly factor-like uncharacterized protein